ncbi:DUF1801 domain-containing protein [Mesorhizobium sp. C416B]|uniref:DUF1801 domain-containing protein n=1 Tax=unclassified Mesorhizobium TaxID=325217 RepID=UPI0003CE7BB7|nr:MULTISPECIES: DUF1801 domain-containing protein [unclassified Mesorhizobium]ESX52055.1 hypothetical protein X762_01110 [Mesorhizobium sp. LSHC426A00]ESX59034.1 hypothetical protein X761_03700 [Mesorhizobium sp. LSHC424B00]ESX76099.1 hypothetical protein X758_00045 [Mesorhizobium sp. LSHC416B00]WJI64723.1 DUF1801 domain-containing protein [Mesorhizobium sp. C416B]
MKISMSSKDEGGASASERIDAQIRELDDWRGKTLASLRKTILDADPEIIEEWKWMGSPVWSRDGMIAVGNAHKDKVKLTFSHGASLPDPDRLFNNGLNGKVWRAIDVSEGDEIDADALKALVRAAIAYNRAKKKPARSAKAKD